MPRRPRLGWLLAGPLGVASVAEVLLITMQRWRGVPSHFNEAAFDAAVFSAMGVMVAVAALVIAAVTVWSFISLRAARAWPLPSALGWCCWSPASCSVGRSSPTAWASRGTGDRGGQHLRRRRGMKVPHAVSLHAVQLLPALAWLLGEFSGWAERRRTRVVLVAAAGYLGLFAVTVVQTFSGVPTLELAAGVAVLLVASVLALAGPFAVTMWELARRWRGTPPPSSRTAAG